MEISKEAILISKLDSVIGHLVGEAQIVFNQDEEAV